MVDQTQLSQYNLLDSVKSIESFHIKLVPKFRKQELGKVLSSYWADIELNVCSLNVCILPECCGIVYIARYICLAYWWPLTRNLNKKDWTLSSASTCPNLYAVRGWHSTFIRRKTSSWWDVVLPPPLCELLKRWSMTRIGGRVKTTDRSQTK